MDQKASITSPVNVQRQ